MPSPCAASGVTRRDLLGVLHVKPLGLEIGGTGWRAVSQRRAFGAISVLIAPV